MQDPAKEVSQVVTLVTAAINPEVQRLSVLQYYAPNAGFRHPLCSVAPGHNSRNQILGILQWYRVMSPVIKIEVRDVTYNAEKNELFLDVVQVFHIRWSPLRPAESRLIVHLVLQPSVEDPNLMQIALHEDFYHPEDLVALVIPPLIPLIRIAHKFGTLSSVINAKVFGLLGYWTARDSEGGRGEDLVPSTPREISSPTNDTFFDAETSVDDGVVVTSSVTSESPIPSFIGIDRPLAHGVTRLPRRYTGLDDIVKLCKGVILNSQQ